MNGLTTGAVDIVAGAMGQDIDPDWLICDACGLNIPNPFPITDQGNQTIDCFTIGPEVYALLNESAATTTECVVREMFCNSDLP